MKKILLTISKLLTVVVVSAGIAACGDSSDEKKDNSFAAVDETPSGNTSLISASDNGYYVLCEGTYPQYNASLDFINSDNLTEYTNAFSTINGMGIGGTANDMIQVGEYIFVAVTDDAMVRVLNAKDMTVYKRFSLLNNSGVNREPRHLVYYQGDVYVTCFDGNVVRINVNQMKITGVLPTQGANPEGIAECNGRLYVANSGGKSYPNYDKTVSVIDPVSFSVEKIITVEDNPQIVKAYNGKVYTVSTGDYTSDYRLTVIEGTQKVDSLDINMTDFDFCGGYLYYVYKPWGSGNAVLNKINLNDLHSQPQSFASAPDNLATPYRIQILPTKFGDSSIFVFDTKNAVVSGQVFEFVLNGQLFRTFNTSVGPNKILIKTGVKAI
ncbi:MAG: hypothetical protein J6M30_05940 [Bacteroidales bacterium]|nr:hypothetical protein [Bacteroidales bacterium]